MNEFKSIEIFELRRIAAKDFGIKNVAKFRKAALVAEIEKIVAERAAAAEAAKPAEKAKPKGSKRCESCSTRPIGRDARKDGLGHLCDPCYTFSGWENTHSDHGHDAINAEVEDKGGEPADYLSEEDLAELKYAEGCWVCHPELNQASVEYVAPKGTSRKGMVMNVPVRASGTTKAGTVVERVAAKTSASTEIKETKTSTTLIIDFMDTRVTLVWDARGGFDYRASSVQANGKVRKIRNVSAALKAIGA